MTVLDKCAETQLRICSMTAFDRLQAAKMLSQLLPAEFPADFLPATGVMAEFDNKPICFLPIYLEQSSKVAVLGQFIADKNADRRLLAKAVRFLIAQAKVFAKEHKKKYLVSIFGCNSINRIADKMGFIPGDVAEEKIFYLGGE